MTQQPLHLHVRLGTSTTTTLDSGPLQTLLLPPPPASLIPLPTLSDQSHRNRGQQVCTLRAKTGKFIF